MRRPDSVHWGERFGFRESVGWQTLMACPVPHRFETGTDGWLLIYHGEYVSERLPVLRPAARSWIWISWKFSPAPRLPAFFRPESYERIRVTSPTVLHQRPRPWNR